MIFRKGGGAKGLGFIGRIALARNRWISPRLRQGLDSVEQSFLIAAGETSIPSEGPGFSSLRGAPFTRARFW
jgi:hypothetical protein